MFFGLFLCFLVEGSLLLELFKSLRSNSAVPDSSIEDELDPEFSEFVLIVRSDKAVATATGASSKEE
jgi:hypothetical protein